MSAELKQLFHSPDELSDQELDILRLKLQNQRRVPKIAIAFCLVGAACIDGVVFRRNPSMLRMGMGAIAGYAFGGYGASTMTSNILTRKFDYDILIAQEGRQQRRTMNLAGYGNEHMGANRTNSNKSWDHPY